MLELMGPICNHSPHNGIEELLVCLHENYFININESKVKKSKDKITIKSEKSTIELLGFDSFEEASKYCENNTPKYRSFYMGSIAVVETKNKKNDINFSEISKFYIDDFKRKLEQ